jgi:Domain of unknown function (DUF1707)/2TM domain
MDREPGDQRRASLRASDADREQFVEQLRQHHAEGRLTVEELTERTGRAYAARTLGDLDALATDLPPLHQPAGARGAAPAPAGPPRPPAATAGQAAARAALLRSLLWYGLLSVVLLVVWAMSGREYFWPIWPILGFALFLGWQAFNLLGPQAQDQRRHRDRDR